MKQIFIAVLVSLSFSFMANAQIDISADKLSFEEKVAIGKAHIDEPFPDCDFDYLYPHCVLNKDIAENNEGLTKDSWAEIYPWEYELYILQ